MNTHPLALSILCLLLLLGAVPALAATARAPKPLQTFTIKEYLRHQWTDELVHFPIAYTGRAPKSLTLTDETGQPVPCQVTGLSAKGGKVTGTVWTVLSLPPKGIATFQLRPGKSAATLLRLQAEGDSYVLGNECLALRLPRLPGALASPVALTALPAPLLAVSDKDGKNWLGQGSWVNADQPLLVKDAVSTVLEEGPVRITVRYRLTFTDGRYYQADISLGARQDAMLFTDDTNIEAPKAAFRFSFQPGLNADRVYWINNFYADPAKGLTPAPIDFSKEQVICNICPWSYWWNKDQATSTGFYKAGADTFVGVIALRPSRWTPYGWDGLDRTKLPVTAWPGGNLDLTLALLAWPRQHADLSRLNPYELIAFQYSQEHLSTINGMDSTLPVMPLHRELAITVGSATEHVVNDSTKAKLRRQLLKYSEFPLDEVKGYGFDYTPAPAAQQHPFLLFTQGDIDRVRRQAKTIPSVQAELARLNAQIGGGMGDNLVAKIQQGPDGWQKFYQENFLGNALRYGTCAEAYMISDEKKFGIMLAAGVKGMARENVEQVLDAPWRPCLGGYAHVYPGNWTNLIFAYDAIAGTDYLTAEEKQDINAAIVFGAHVVAHADYWNPERGLSSANPNMTALVRLPRGLLALFLAGHPLSDTWLKTADDELQHELKDWVAPGGAWIECPGYTVASLDPMFTFMQAMKNVKGKNYFADPQCKATLDYYGFLLTPPDRRFPPANPQNLPAPMVLPSIGDTQAGTVVVYPGWVAHNTAQTDPAFSARENFYWKAQNCPVNAMYAQGYMPAMTDPELPAAPPEELSRSFPGFGSIMRSSWTDPNASYIAHRTGPFLAHYHDDYNEIVYYAKGSPLCLDFGNMYAPVERYEAWYHNTVCFAKEDVPGNTGGEFVEGRMLPHVIDYSAGKAKGVGGQVDLRHVLLIKSADPMGANYLVVRDNTTDGQPDQQFYWNLWCLSKDPEITGNVVHFAGQLGVDLDVHLLAPANPQISKDSWSWKEQVATWGWFSEQQYGIHVNKQGSSEDYFAVLYPRAAGQGPAQVTTLGSGQGVAVKHMEGTDVVLLSPAKPATVTFGDVQLTGEIAFARGYTNGTLRLAVVKGAGANATLGRWGLHSDGPVALTISATRVEGESNGDAHTAQITLSPAFGTVKVTLDGKTITVKQENNLLTIDLPAGEHTFEIDKD